MFCPITPSVAQISIFNISISLFKFKFKFIVHIVVHSLMGALAAMAACHKLLQSHDIDGRGTVSAEVLSSLLWCLALQGIITSLIAILQRTRKVQNLLQCKMVSLLSLLPNFWSKTCFVVGTGFGLLAIGRSGHRENWHANDGMEEQSNGKPWEHPWTWEDRPPEEERHWHWHLQSYYFFIQYWHWHWHWHSSQRA